MKLRHVASLAVFSAVISFVALLGTAQAQTYDFTAIMDGLQEVPPNASPGTGFATVSYNQGTGVLAWDISWSGLLATETAMHFHGPAPVGVNAGVQVNIGAISGLTSPSIGSMSITAVQAADLLNDLWYINLHSESFPGGEIRGQVLLVPEPATVTLACGALLAGLMVYRRRR